MAAERFPPVDFARFHREVVPKLLARHAGLAGADVAGVAPLALRVGDDAFTYVAEGGTVSVVEGDAPANAVAAMAPEAWSDLAHELRSAFGLVIGEAVDFLRGEFGLLARWEPALRAVWHGRPIYDDAAAASLDGLDLTTTFDPAVAGDAELRDFFAATGFLHLRGVFSDDEMDALAAEAERLAAGADFDDGRSWWARTADGRDVCCRVIYSGERSELVRSVATDPRIRRVVEAVDPSLALCSDRLDGEPLLFKHPGVVEGLADLPWHRDCGMGGHPVLCPALKFGIQIDAATPANGQLHYLAGSHTTSSHYPSDDEVARWPTHAVETARGDVTVHHPHVLHAAPPPGGDHTGRRTLYVNYEQPLVWEVVAPGQGYNDSVLARRGRVAL